MAIDCQGLAVHAVQFVPERGPVFFAAMPSAARGSAADGAEERQRLVTALWGHLAAGEHPLRQRCKASDGAASPIRVVSGPLGRPSLRVGDDRGPAISFSRGGGKVWAALSGSGSDIGIDVAGADEFRGAYPFHRVFQQDELHHAMKLTGGDRAEASALLWSVKEAVVKALGCAFHLVDPRQITVYPSAGGTEDGGHAFPVGLTGKALARFPRAADQSLRVRSLPQGTMWLSIALLDWRPAGHE